ncbi:MAG: hypothetical protein QXV32_06735 [Conexivisphaerales archaeon]
MDDSEVHIRLAKEKRLAAIEEFRKQRYTVVADLAIKAVEQAIEAAAAKKYDMHFHLRPREAHSKRREWVRENFPDVARYMDELWGAYGALGYEGVDGERAKKAVEAMERVLDEIGARAGIDFS